MAVLLSMDAASQAQRPWELLGEAEVNGQVDHDVIEVKNAGTFRTIQIRVKGGVLNFLRVTVHFTTGKDREVEMVAIIPDGGQTRAIDLPGNKRKIRTVESWYAKAGWSKGPALALFGQR